jgi:polyisoprenoid-binding protein YceI
MFHVFLTTLVLAAGPLTETSPERPISIPDTPADTLTGTWVLIVQDSEARYRVREQLAGFDFPNDAVGVTKDLSGTLVLAPGGTIVPEGSEFRVGLDSLTSDSERRDGYVRRRTLEVDRYPEVVLIPRRMTGLPATMPESGPVTFQMESDVTLRGQTRPILWEVTAEFGPDSVSGLATTAFPFETFGITIPQVARVLSVDDNIRLELQFRMEREGSL